MTSIFTGAFWKDTAERVVSSAAQGALVGWAGVQVLGPDTIATAGEAAAFGAVGMGVASFLKCLIASRAGDEGTASLVSLQPDRVGAHEAPAESVD